MDNLGQHTLKNQSIIEESVKLAKISEKDVVLEIGAGTGNLTSKLAEKGKIIAVEIDPKYENKLKKINAQIIIGNGLEVVKRTKYNKIVSNLPYHICEPLFHTIIRKEPELCVFITGKKFFEILNNETKIGLGINSLYSITKIMNVHKSEFEPQPKIDSVLFVLEKKTLTEKEKIIKEIFQQEDKTVKNALVNSYKRVLGVSNKEALKKISNLPETIKNKRVMHLSNLQFKNLIKEI